MKAYVEIMQLLRILVAKGPSDTFNRKVAKHKKFWF